MTGVQTCALPIWLDEGFPTVGAIGVAETQGKSSLVIARLDGVILASTPSQSPFLGGAKLDDLCTEEERGLLRVARGGIFLARRSEGRILAAGLLKRGDEVLALGFIRTGAHYTLRNALLGSGSNLFYSALLTACGGALVGTAFGLATARAVHRRLLGIALAAEHWATGDLKWSAPEVPADEFGLLGARLNGMVADLEQVMRLRRQVAALEERQKITRNLHDTVKQQAFATSLMVVSAQERIDAGDVVGGQDALREAEILSRRMQEDLRTILSDLRTARMSPLPEALKRLAEEWRRQAGVTLKLDLAPEAEGLPHTIGEEIVCIVQEALANVARHSGASRVEVALSLSEGGWCLCIKDNGRGIAAGRGSGEGLGLQTMRERGDALPKGRFAISEAPGGGTCVSVTFREAQQ